jgi:hypothetical protein
MKLRDLKDLLAQSTPEEDDKHLLIEARIDGNLYEVKVDENPFAGNKPDTDYIWLRLIEVVD